MGGMQALAMAGCLTLMYVSFMYSHSDYSYKHSAQQIAFDEVGRQAIMSDHAWNGGNYY